MTTTVVVKVGGEVVGGPERGRFAGDVVALAGTDTRVVIVHGGGPQANELETRLGLSSKKVGGRRITDAASLDVMKMVLAGRLNVDLCAALVAAGARPVGLHGASATVIRAVRRPPRVVSGGGPDPIDFGLVGDVVGFNQPFLDLLLSGGYLPVLACLGIDPTGQVYNINADIVANQLAQAMGADCLYLITSTPGVLRDVRDPATRIPALTAAEARRAIADGAIAGGMIPKIEEALLVLGRGVKSIRIVDRLSAEGTLLCP